MPKLMILKGLPASGKSSYAHELVAGGGWTEVNKDSIRKLLNEPWSFELEKAVIKLRNEMVITGLKGGINVVCSDTNLAPKHEKHLTDIAYHCGATVEVKFFDVAVDECIRRDSLRTGAEQVGEGVIRDMANKYLGGAPKALPYTETKGLPTCILVDLDGTVCLHNGRSPFDYDKCDTDLPNTPVIAVLNAIRFQGLFHTIFMSGRDDSCRVKSEAWLEKHAVPGATLFMRKTGDYRKDSIVKEELLREHIFGKYNVLFCLDDRQQVVDHYRSLGLTVFQVAKGDF